MSKISSVLTILSATTVSVCVGHQMPCSAAEIAADCGKPRVIVTTDGEADDRCSMVRFLLTTNEFEVEGIINSSSQFHWEGGKGWNAFHPPSWLKDYIDLYAKVYENLRRHDPAFPTPEHLLSKWRIGNISGIGEDHDLPPWTGGFSMRVREG